MSIGRLVECEMLQHDWSRMQEANGSAERIPIAFSELLQAQGPDEAVRAYWKLENHVVVQGALFEVSVSTVSLIGAALATPARPKWVMIQLFELLFQIVSGESHADEISRGFGDLVKIGNQGRMSHMLAGKLLVNVELTGLREGIYCSTTFLTTGNIIILHNDRIKSCLTLSQNS